MLKGSGLPCGLLPFYLNAITMKQLVFISLLLYCLTAVGQQRKLDFILEKLYDGGKSDYVMIFAHRGDWRNAPENSIQAYQNCINAGLDGIEVDVQMTKDSVLVMMHDQTLERTTTGKGKVSDYTLAELKELYLRNPIRVVTRQRIPTFDEVLELAKGKILLQVDKWGPVAQLVIEAVKRHGCENQIILRGTKSSSQLKEEYGDLLANVIYIPVLSCKGEGDDEKLNDYMEHIKTPVIGISFKQEDYEVLKRVPEIQKRGFRVWYNSLWSTFNAGHDDERSVNHPEDGYGWLLEKGANIIFSDHPFLLDDYLKKLGRRDAGHSLFKKGMDYTDAASLTIVNKPQQGGPTFQRIEVERYPDLNPTVDRYYRFSTGLAIAFRTDSRSIRAYWKTCNKSNRFETPIIGQKGLDLYIRNEGKWVFAGTGTPTHGTEHEAALIENMEEGSKECLLYLPLFDEVEDLQIGVEEASLLEALPNPFKHKVVAIGSSITHGVGVSRPGMTWPARMERALDMEFCNLGASGQCKLDAFYAQIAAETEADAFIFDTFSNPNAKQIEERLADFVARIRTTHPTTPLIFLQTEVRETGTFNLKRRQFELEKRMAAEEGLEQLMKEDRNLYFINPGMPLGDDHEATVDGVHPTDMGHERILELIRPKVEKILRKYGVK